MAVCMYVGDRALGRECESSSTPYLQNRERSFAVVAAFSKSSLNFLEHLKERGGKEWRETVAGGREGDKARRKKDLTTPQLSRRRRGGLVASRRIGTSLKTSLVTFGKGRRSENGNRSCETEFVKGSPPLCIVISTHFSRLVCASTAPAPPIHILRPSRNLSPDSYPTSSRFPSGLSFEML